MTTPANHGPNNGANQPEDDDPFGYLYEDGQAAGATPPGQGGGYGYPGPAGGQPGVPRTSYNQVRTVGDRPQRGQRGPVPYQQGPQQPPAYQAQYQAPEALQAGGYGVPPQQQPPQYTQSVPLPGSGGGHGGGGSSRKGMLIAAVAVVAAVAIGIGAAVIFGKKDKPEGGDKAATPGQSQSAPATSPSGQPSGSASPAAPLPKGDAGGPGMVISGGATLAKDVPGAKSAGGQYVGNFGQQGAALTWTVDVPDAGDYTLFVNYGVPGKDAKATLTVNGKTPTQSLNLANFAKAPEGAWDKGWTRTFAWIKLTKGSNTMKISCEPGNQCDAVFDQLELAAGQVRR
ncbi:CBM35 domain-containing protein [Streptomyces sp. NPDC002812]|uniref:CBM35 domain-containing protein n=1 Tax=Streptomyces sp. NPDC002812 TaxID=3154434 RepID=UPI003332C4FC